MSHCWTHTWLVLLPACWLHLPQLSSAMLSSMLLLGLSCFKIHQARSCRDLHLTVSFATPFCITGCNYCSKSRTISPGTHSLQSWDLCAAPYRRRESLCLASQSMAAFACCRNASLPKVCAGDGGCLGKGRAQGGLPCWRPTACTEHNTQKSRGKQIN